MFLGKQRQLERTSTRQSPPSAKRRKSNGAEEGSGKLLSWPTRGKGRASSSSTTPHPACRTALDRATVWSELLLPQAEQGDDLEPAHHLPLYHEGGHEAARRVGGGDKIQDKGRPWVPHFQDSFRTSVKISRRRSAYVQPMILILLLCAFFVAGCTVNLSS